MTGWLFCSKTWWKSIAFWISFSKKEREIGLLAETTVRKFQSFRNIWKVLANNEQEQQKCSWNCWSALAKDIYYLTNNLMYSWCKHQGSFLRLLKHYIICPTKINEWACKDLCSHKGECCQQEQIKYPESNLQFTAFWLEWCYCGYSWYRVW